MTDCIICCEPIPEKTKPEHILLSALGGRMTVRSVICPDCNHKMGIGPDQDLANSVATLRNSANLKSGNGKDAPWIKGMNSKEHRFDLSPGMQPIMRPRKPLSVENDGNGFTIKIDAYSEIQADHLLTAAAKKIAKSLGHENDAIIQAIKADIAKNRVSTLQLAPTIHHQLQFGTGQSQQAMAKATLVLWAKLVGNEEVLASRYDSIRNYIINGDAVECVENKTKLDTRALQKTDPKYGTNPNLIWAGSNSQGRVFGYFRLYGAIGWRVSICDKGAPPNRSICLISNPFNNKVWSLLVGKDSPIDMDWIDRAWDNCPPDYNAVQQSLEKFGEQAQQSSQNIMLKALIQEALEKAGLEEGDIITEDDVRFLSRYVGKRLAVNFTRTPIEIFKNDEDF